MHKGNRGSKLSTRYDHNIVGLGDIYRYHDMRIYVILGFWKLFYLNISVVISWFTLYLVHYS